MFARSTTIISAPEKLEAGVAHVRDVVLPQVRGFDGCTGLSLIADRQSGRCIATSSWRDEASMRQSASGVTLIRDEAAKVFGADSSKVEEWMVAYLHRDHRAAAGACARVTWLSTDPEALDRTIEAFRTMAMPQAEKIAGFCSVSLFVDRASGRCCTTASYDSTEAMAAARDIALGLRVDIVQDVGAVIDEVAEFELLVAHLDVPELV